MTETPIPSRATGSWHTTAPSSTIPPGETDEWLLAYRDGGFGEIQGWLSPGVMDLVRSLAAAQGAMQMTDGGAMEIGIFHGRFFIALNGVVRDATTPSIAIDLFADQALNIDGSGMGDEATFRANLARYDRHGGRNVTILQADSTTLAPSDILRQVPIRPRLISIDGGHTAEHVVSDLTLSAAVVAPAGLIIVDDILSAGWLGVFEGVVTYLMRRPTLWPVAVGYNKLVMCPMSVHEAYRSLIMRSGIVSFPKTTRLCGYDVLVAAH